MLIELLFTIGFLIFAGIGEIFGRRIQRHGGIFLNFVLFALAIISGMVIWILIWETIVPWVGLSSLSH